MTWPFGGINPSAYIAPPPMTTQPKNTAAAKNHFGTPLEDFFAAWLGNCHTVLPGAAPKPPNGSCCDCCGWKSTIGDCSTAGAGFGASTTASLAKSASALAPDGRQVTTSFGFSG